MSTKAIRNISVISAIIGLIDSVYLTWLKLGSDEIICIGGCDVVNASKYSEIFGIPIAIFGALSYLVILGIVLLRDRWGLLAEHGSNLLFGITLVGVLYSAYLTYLEVAVIHAICPFCVVSAVVMVVLFAVSIIELMKDFSAEDE